uniref:Pentatricopeptide repeat-containing protein n=1 Tax=Schrenkiella parvula TaxID=98039 RepID=E5F732_9BRAS|nr:unknown [Schrenkiella parvula]
MFACLPLLGDITRKSTNLLLKNVFVRNFVVHADHVFEELPQGDLSTLNSQLSSYLRRGSPNGTLDLFLKMHRASPDLSSHTFTPVLGACALLSYPEMGRQVHALMFKQGAETGTISKTALIDMYSKYGQLVDSVTVFESVEDKDVVSWNALLSGFLRNGKGKEALGLFAAMYREKVEISEFTLCSVVKTCASLKILQQGKQVHAMVVVTGRDLVVLGTAIISFYSSVGLVTEAMKVYISLNVHTDEVMLNSLISGCIRNRNYREAFLLMSRQRPNVRVLVSSLAGCSDNSDMWIGKQIHCAALRNGFVSDTRLCNGLMDMYGKCGRIVQARTLFRAIQSKTVVSWTSMIDAYAVNGDGVKALQIFREMCEEGTGVLPNSVTFLVVLSACAHAGLVEEGKECFGMMKEKYGLAPGTEHYVCFIDILSKAGDTEEIWRLVERMMVNNNRNLPCAIWVAVLSACSLNMDVTRGEFAARRVMEETGPENASIYVLVSNFYAAIGKWHMVEEMREKLKKKGLVKAAGRSLFI